MYIVTCNTSINDSVLGHVMVEKIEKRTKSLRTAKSLVKFFMAHARAQWPEGHIVCGYQREAIPESMVDLTCLANNE